MSVLTSLRRCLDAPGGWERHQGDIGQFLAGQALGNAGVPFPNQALPKLTATWKVRTAQMAPGRQRRFVWVRGCTAQDLSLFFRALLDGLKTSGAEEFSDNASFSFRTASGDYLYSSQANGFTVCFPSLLAVVVEKRRGAFVMLMSREPA